MPTKHIESELWQRVEQKTVETILHTRMMVKETDILQEIIKKGLEHTSVDELGQFVLQRKRAKGE